jgi:ribosomal protein S25
VIKKSEMTKEEKSANSAADAAKNDKKGADGKEDDKKKDNGVPLSE